MRLRVRRLARADIDGALTWYLERDQDAAAAFVWGTGIVAQDEIAADLLEIVKPQLAAFE